MRRAQRSFQRLASSVMSKSWASRQFQRQMHGRLSKMRRRLRPLLCAGGHSALAAPVCQRYSRRTSGLFPPRVQREQGDFVIPQASQSSLISCCFKWNTFIATNSITRDGWGTKDGPKKASFSVLSRKVGRDDCRRPSPALLARCGGMARPPTADAPVRRTRCVHPPPTSLPRHGRSGAVT